MKLEMSIRGMTCSQCQKRVLDALRTVSGVLAAEVNVEAGTVWVDVLDGVSREQLSEAVEDWGYQVVSIEQKVKSVLTD